MTAWCGVAPRSPRRLRRMRWFLIGSVAIVAFDAAAALASGPLGFEYGAWWPGFIGAAAIYGAPAFMAARERGSAVAGAATGVGVALVDVVVGWPVSGAIIPGYFPDGRPDEVAQTVALVAVGVGVLGAVIGLAAGFLGLRQARADEPPG